jgi:Protein of unknown function (DUF2786)
MQMRQRTRTSRGESRRTGRSGNTGRTNGAGRSGAPGAGRASGSAHGSVEARVEAAVASARYGAAPSPLLVDALAREPSPVAGELADPVDRALAHALVAAVADAWQQGWQPADLHRAVARAHGRAAARLLVRAMVAEVARHAEPTVPARWRQQLDALGADVSPAAAGAPWAVPWPGPATASAEPSVARVQAVSVAVATLAQLRGLPRLPKLGPAPGETGAVGGHRPRPDAAVLHKVTSLLAKAESTTFPDEAEALTAKAQELMTRHAIDRAQLEAGRGADPVAGGRRVAVDDPYANARYLLLSAVADANRCRAVWTRQWGFSTVFGDEGDLDAVELLFTSLLVQATRAMVLEPLSATGNGGRTRSFRHAFLVAFAGRIGERLARASEAATADAARQSTAVVPLFEARRAAADRALGEAFPETRTMRVSARNAEGWQAGVRAADRAQLGHERPVPGTSPPGLTR